MSKITYKYTLDSKVLNKIALPKGAIVTGCLLQNDKDLVIYALIDDDIKDIEINNGAEMIVAIAGEILRMPGLPKQPQALHIDIVGGNIEGLS